VATYQQGLPTIVGEEVVVLSKVLPDEINSGYHDVSDLIIARVNGRKINHLRDLIRIVEKDNDSNFVVFESRQGFKVVLERKSAEAAQDKILETYSVPADRSPDLLHQIY
jgi:hypothetical protein